MKHWILALALIVAIALVAYVDAILARGGDTCLANDWC